MKEHTFTLSEEHRSTAADAVARQLAEALEDRACMILLERERNQQGNKDAAAAYAAGIADCSRHILLLRGVLAILRRIG